MVTPTPAQDPTAEQNKAQATAALDAALHKVFKGLSAEQKQSIRQRVAKQLQEVYSENGNKPISPKETKETIDAIISNTLQPAESVEDEDKRSQLLEKTKDVATLMEGSRKNLSKQVDSALTLVKTDNGVKDAQKLRIIDDLSRSIGPILTTHSEEISVEEALTSSIAASLKNATHSKYTIDLDKAAENMAKEVMRADAEMKTEMGAVLDTLKIKDGKIERDLTEAEKEQIIASTSARIWPEMMREEIQPNYRPAVIKSILSDVINEQTGTLTVQNKTEIQEVGERIKAHIKYAGVDKNTSLVTSTVNNALGGGGSILGGTTIGGMNVGMVTMGAAGVTAVTALSELSTAAKVAIGAAVIGGALAYENGLLNGVLPGSTPAGAKPEGKSAALPK